MNTENTSKVAEKKKRKRKMLVWLIIVSIFAVISYILLENPEIFEKEENKVTSMYSDTLYSYVFYPTDYELDVTQDERYMQLDRYVHYKNGAVTVIVTEDEQEDYNDAVQFFMGYFKTVVAGDAETYNTFFTDAYYEKYDPYLQFAPQMIYDIEIEQLSEVLNKDGSMNWTFNVKYKIHRNDGTFRNDLESDAAKKLYFELLTDETGEVKINNISYYKKG